jgi:hypothetical protein
MKIWDERDKELLVAAVELIISLEMSPLFLVLQT